MASDRSVEGVPSNIAVTDGNGNGRYSDTYFTLGEVENGNGYEFNPLPNLDVDPRTKQVATCKLVQQILVDKKVHYKESTKNGITVYKVPAKSKQHVVLGFVNNGSNKVKMAEVATIRKLAKVCVARKAVISDVTSDYVY